MQRRFVQNISFASILGKLLVVAVLFTVVSVTTASALASSCKGRNGLEVTIGTPGLENLCQDSAGNPLGNTPIMSLVQGIANYIVGIIGAVAVLVIIITGIQLISSAGNPDAIKTAKKRLVTTITSLFILISMRVILNLIISGGNF